MDIEDWVIVFVVLDRSASKYNQSRIELKSVLLVKQQVRMRLKKRR